MFRHCHAYRYLLPWATPAPPPHAAPPTPAYSRCAAGDQGIASRVLQDMRQLGEDAVGPHLDAQHVMLTTWASQLDAKFSEQDRKIGETLDRQVRSTTAVALFTCPISTGTPCRCMRSVQPVVGGDLELHRCYCRHQSSADWFAHRPRLN